jgi:hypothetical protein
MSDLTGIKPGDSVGMLYGFGHNEAQVIGVMAVTKAYGGTIIVGDYGGKFDLKGRERTKGSHGSNIYRLDDPEWIRRGVPTMRRKLIGRMLRALEDMNGQNLCGEEDADAIKAIYQRMAAKKKAGEGKAK